MNEIKILIVCSAFPHTFFSKASPDSTFLSGDGVFFGARKISNDATWYLRLSSEFFLSSRKVGSRTRNLSSLEHHNTFLSTMY